MPACGVAFPNSAIDVEDISHVLSDEYAGRFRSKKHQSLMKSLYVCLRVCRTTLDVGILWYGANQLNNGTQ